MVVLPEYRGAGLGSRVVEEAEAWIGELGYKRIVIDSRVEAVPFYVKLMIIPVIIIMKGVILQIR